MSRKLTPNEVIDFSAGYICSLFKTNQDERGVDHSALVSDGIQAVIDNFGIRDASETGYAARRLFLPTFWTFSRMYGELVDVVREGEPTKSDFFWRLRNGSPDRSALVKEILDKELDVYVAANLSQCEVD